MKMLFNKINTIALATVMLFMAGCKVETIEDPNNPGLVPISANPTLSEIQNLVDGTEAAMRNNLGTYYDDVSVIGREYYRFSTSDPRFTSDLLGKGNAVLDNNTFYITNPYSARYRVVRNTNILMDGLRNTRASITDAQRRAGIAYAKTVQAYELLLVFNLLYDNGIRVDVKNPDALGPFLSRQQSLDAIMNLMNEANTDLKNNNVNFPFTTTLFSKNAAEFSKFNRALAARVAVYRQDWATANTALTESFFSLTDDLKAGVYYKYSSAGGDELNPLFIPLNSPAAENRLAQPSFVADASANDNRVTSKVSLRTSSGSQDGLTSSYDFAVYRTNIDPISIIRNEELVLLYAEVKAQTSLLPDAVIAINRIRTSAGLLPYAGAVTPAALITEILFQRRYSLYGEGHRWIDVRRYNLLSSLPIDRTNDNVWQQFPRPANE